MAELTPLYMDISGAYSGDELGLPYRDILGEGVVGANDLLVAQHAAGANLSVDVAAGAAWVLGDTNPAAQPVYRVRNDATVNLGISPDPSNPRKVLVVAQLTDETFFGTGRTWALQAIHGTPAASPATPATPASAMPLALITVAAGATSIVTANISDLRVPAMFSGQAGRYQAYTPAWTAPTNPALGNGQLTGKFVKVGKMVHAQIRLVMGSTTTYGVGQYKFALPVPARTGFFALGSGYIYDSSSDALTAGCAVNVGDTDVTLDITGSSGGYKIGGTAAPFGWAVNDEINLTLTYEAA